MPVGLNFSSLTGQGFGLRNVVAAGTTQATATAIPDYSGVVVYVTAANGAKGVLLPVADVGHFLLVKNADVSNAALLVYPPVGGFINGLAANAPYTMAVGEFKLFSVAVAGTWIGEGSTGSGAAVQHINVQLTNTQVKTMFTTPVNIIPAPGAGRYLQFHDAIITYKYGGTNALTGGGAVSLVDHGTSNSVSTDSVAAATFTGTATVATQMGPLVGGSGSTRPANTGIDITNATAVFAGNAGLNDTASVDIWYSVVTP